MHSKKSADLIGHSKFLPWQQLNGCSMTLPRWEGCGLQDDVSHWQVSIME